MSASSRSSRGGLAAAVVASSGDRKRKVSKYTDTKNSNALGFVTAPAAATSALQRWRAAQPAAASASASDMMPRGVLSVDEGADELDHAASVAQQLEREHAMVRALPPAVPDTRTANGDASFSTSRCARLDLFFQMVRGAEAAKIERLCAAAWGESAEHVVQLVLHGRDARGGKGERLVSYFALLWLRRHKPATYLLNLTNFLAIGCFKDLLQIAAMVSDSKLEPLGAKPREDLLRKADKQQRREKRRRVQRANAAAAARAEAAAAASDDSAAEPVVVSASAAAASGTPAVELVELEVMAEYLAADWERLKKHEAKMAERKARAQALSQLGVSSDAAMAASSDEDKEDDEKSSASVDDQPRAAAAASSSVAAEFLADAASDSDSDNDEKMLQAWEAIDMAEADAAAVPAPQEDGTPASVSRKPRQPRPARVPHCQLSLASKWAPTEGSSFDKKHHLAKRLARLLFPNEPKCFRLYRDLLSQCRAHLAVPERYLCAKQFERIDFEKIPAKCHQILKKALTRHCGERYAEYKANLSQGHAKINTAGVLPHELATPYIRDRSVTQPDPILEGAWSTLLSKLRAKCVSAGGLGSAVAVVDVSGSMGCFNGLPMNVAISLGLLVSELSAPPFKHRCITFSETPQWHVVPSLASSSLLKQVRSLEGAHWGCSTNLQAVFRLVLDTAIRNRCSPEDLPKTIFIFSDMQFNAAVGPSGAGGCDAAIRAAFAREGYAVPSLVYWNLNGLSHADCPVDVSTPGVALIGGYSAELLKAFLDGSSIDPMAILLHSIAPYKAVIEESER